MTQVIQRPLSHGPENQHPNRIIVHAMVQTIRITPDVVHWHPKLERHSGERLYAATFLDEIGLSAHILVASPRGERIRCREDTQGAWHAKGFNTDSLGIEVLVGHVDGYGEFLDRIREPWVERDTYISAVEQVIEWCRKWDIAPEPGTLDRHCDLDPERKYDPGAGFPWARFVSDVKGVLNA